MMHAHVRHQGQGWQPRSMVGEGGGLESLGGEEVEMKKTEAAENQES